LQGLKVHTSISCYLLKSCASCRDLGDTFKWAYFGPSNTDTAVFLDAAENMVKGLDADMPYFLSGDLTSLLF